MKKLRNLIEIDEKKINIVIKVIKEYQDLFIQETIQEQTLKVYKFEKPLTDIEIYSQDYNRIMEFIENLRQFFFVTHNISKGNNLNNSSQLNSNDFYQGPIFISRFNTLVNIAIKFDGLSDEYADLAGILFGYNLKDIAGYGLKEVKDKNLVKE